MDGIETLLSDRVEDVCPPSKWSKTSGDHRLDTKFLAREISILTRKIHDWFNIDIRWLRVAKL